jgi:Ca2+/Na+ antiporter
MAAASSFPDLCAEIVGVFLSSDNSAGTGTVVGSAIFNQLVCIGGSILMNPTKTITLERAPLVRDIFFYSVAMVELYFCFTDGEIHTHEAWGLLLTYVAYVLVNVYWAPILKYTRYIKYDIIRKSLYNESVYDARKSPRAAAAASAELASNADGGEEQQRLSDPEEHERMLSEQLLAHPYLTHKGSQGSFSEVNVSFVGDAFITDLDRTSKDYDKRRGGTKESAAASVSFPEQVYKALSAGEASESSGSMSDSSDDDEISPGNYTAEGQYVYNEGATDALGKRAKTGSFNSSHPHSADKEHRGGCYGAFTRLVKIFTWPMCKFLSLVIVDSRKYPHLFFISFLNSTAILGIIMYFVISWIEKVGCLIGVSAALMGLTVGAAGSSATDALVSFHVARNGLADMAVANALGGNVFDILLCLGLPWVLQTTAFGKTIPIDKGSFDNTFKVQAFVLLFLIAHLFVARFRRARNQGKITIFRASGFLYIALYFTFIGLSIMWETQPK